MKIVKEYTTENLKKEKEVLMAEFGRNKVIPKQFELQALAALSHFPELKEVKIRFEVKKSEWAFASRPDWTTILQNKSRWKYLVVISSYSRKVPDELLLPNLPLNAQIGILGHELSHTVFFLNKSRTDMISIGIKYLNSKYRIKLENETDKEAIRRGLGWQLLEFAKYCRNHPKAGEKLTSWLDRYYLDPIRIMDHMQTTPEYKI